MTKTNATVMSVYIYNLCQRVTWTLPSEATEYSYIVRDEPLPFTISHFTYTWDHQATTGIQLSDLPTYCGALDYTWTFNHVSNGYRNFTVAENDFFTLDLTQNPFSASVYTNNASKGGNSSPTTMLEYYPYIQAGFGDNWAAYTRFYMTIILRDDCWDSQIKLYQTIPTSFTPYLKEWSYQVYWKIEDTVSCDRTDASQLTRPSQVGYTSGFTGCPGYCGPITFSFTEDNAKVYPVNTTSEPVRVTENGDNYNLTIYGFHKIHVQTYNFNLQINVSGWEGYNYSDYPFDVTM